MPQGIHILSLSLLLFTLSSCSFGPTEPVSGPLQQFIDQLGGQAGLETLLDDWTETLQTDPQFAQVLTAETLSQLHDVMLHSLCSFLSIPCMLPPNGPSSILDLAIDPAVLPSLLDSFGTMLSQAGLPAAAHPPFLHPPRLPYR